MPTAQCIQRFIAIVGSIQAQSSIKHQEKERGSVQFIKADNKRPLWGALCEVPPWSDMTVCNFLADPSGVELF